MLRLIVKNGKEQYPNGVSLGWQTFEIECQALEKLVTTCRDENNEITLLAIEVFEKPKPPLAPYVPPVMVPAKPQEELLAELREKHNKSLTGRLREMLQSKPKCIPLP